MSDQVMEDKNTELNASIDNLYAKLRSYKQKNTKLQEQIEELRCERIEE